MLAIITTYEIREGKMEEALEISRELEQQVKDSDPGLLDMFAYTVKGRKHKNKIVFVENYVDGDALNRLTTNAQDLPNYRKLGQLLETVDVLRCVSID